MDEAVVYQDSENSMLIAEMKILVHGADGFLLFPTKTKIADIGQLQALHAHVYYEFFFATKSPIIIVTESGMASYTNSLIIVPPEVKHFTCAEGNDGYRITVTESDVKNIEPNIGLLDFIKRDGISTLCMNEELSYYLEKLVSTDFCSTYGRAKGEALLKLLFLEIGMLLKPMDGPRVSGSINNRYRNIEKIDRFIGTQYNREGVSIEMLAKELCLSVRQVSRIFKKEYGCSFVKKINDKRMSVAAILLKKSSLSVSDIIKELNFETENYFFRMFKKYYGMTPLQYRNQRS